jgi:hypothetical protein
MHACIHPYMHACIHTYIILTQIFIYKNMYRYMYIHEYIHTYIHICMHTSIHTCILIYTIMLIVPQPIYQARKLAYILPNPP